MRCHKTVVPLAAATGKKIETTPLISQDAWEEGHSDARSVIGARVRARKPAILCSHGPVLPDILAELGHGGMGVVYTAHDPRLDRQVAIKVLPPDLTRDETAKQRFLQEAQAASALDHPNICTIHEINETEDGQLYLVMAYYAGETLKQRIEREPLKLADAIDIATQVGQGLAETHGAGIVHRDIKPQNILLTEEGTV